MKRCPFVLCLTNSVAANFTANVLLAIGAKPAMVCEPEEAEELASVADAVLLNVGTVSPLQAEAMREAIAVCREKGTPWVLDPVGVQLLSFRRALVGEFLSLNPSLVRGNALEVKHILGSVPTEEGAVPGWKPTCPILQTGEIDRVIDGPDCQEIAGGVPMLQDVTATGCAQGAICAALLAWGQSPRNACIIASKLMKTAGERAFERSHLPGSFQVALLDSLYELSPIRNEND